MLQLCQIETIIILRIFIIMKQYLLFLMFLVIAIPLGARQVSTDRIKGWLELDKIKQNLTAMINKYNNFDITLKKEMNAILEQAIDGADEIADSDPYAALMMYGNMKTLIDKAEYTSDEIAAINKRFKELIDEINKAYKELTDIRRKHLQFPY